MLANLIGSPNGVGLTKGSTQVHRGRYYVSVRRGGEDIKRDISVAIEKHFQADSLKIVLWDEEEPTFLCVVRVTRSDYEELKKQQGLLIDFDNFPAQLVRLLQQCAANNMFLILQQSDPRQYFFEVVEHNEFRRLVHLSLRTTPATDADVQAHMADTITNLKRALTAAKNSAASSEVVLNDRCSALEKKIQELTLSLTRSEEDRQRREWEHQELLRIERDKLNQERLEWQRNLEQTSKNHTAALQEASLRRDKQVEEANARCRQLKDSISSLESQLSEKSQRLNVLEKEVQKTHIEVATLRAKNSALERESTDRERQLQHAYNKHTDFEKILRDANEQVRDLTTKVQTLQQDKASLEQKVSLSESLVTKHSSAAQATSEQLLKANQIIAKQNSDLAELKEKLICRTAIVLEQEKEIERHAREMSEVRARENEAMTECGRLRGERDELANKLDQAEKTLKDKEEALKNNNLVIQWLHKKMEQNSTAESVLGSVRRPDTVCSADTLALDLHSEETGDARLQEQKSAPRSAKSLDPRYLRPAEENQRRLTEVARGKENRPGNLPKMAADPRAEVKKQPKLIKATSASVYYHR